MPDISKITMPSGTVYDIKDAYARTVIAGGMSFIGVTTTALTDGSTTNPITIDGASVTAQNGNVTVYGNAEFVWVEPTGENGRWAKFGDESNLGDLAYKDSASGTFTPSGSVSGSFTGTPVRLVTDDITTHTGASLTTSNKSVSVSGTATGTVSQPTFTGTGVRLVTGNISVPSSASFTGNEMTSTGSISVNNYSLGSAEEITIEVESREPSVGETANYTPSGSVSAPVISKFSSGSTTTIKNPTSTTKVASVVTANAGSTAPSNPLTYAEVSGETLILNQIGYTTGNTITTSNVTVKTGDASYTASAPTFTGTGRMLEVSVPQDTLMAVPVTKDITVTGTPTGSVSFTNTNKTATVSATSGTATYTPSGTVSQPTFSGTSFTSTGTLTDYATGVSLTGASTAKHPVSVASSGTATYTPSGSISVSFTGTAGTITVS